MPCTWSSCRLTALGIVGVHLFLVQKHEISVPQDMIKKYGSAKKAPSMPFVPHFLLRDMVGWYMALGLLAALAALFPWELGQKADPFGSAPAGIKPEWYFLFMFQTLKDLPAYLPERESPVDRRRDAGHPVLRLPRADGGCWCRSWTAAPPPAGRGGC